MQFEAKLTLDGLMTLVAGVIAFSAVIIQIRSSSKQLRDQIKAQRDAERDERERQTKAVATAILFEIDGFYAGYLRQPRDFLAGKDIEKDELPLFTSIGTNPFPVYQGNTGKIGELPVERVQAVVGCFREADRMVSYFNDYESSFERERQLWSNIGKSISVAEDKADRRAYGDQLRRARTQLARIKDALPEVIKLTYLVCHTLCQFTGVPFEYPRIVVAAEKLSVDEIVASPSDTGTKKTDNRGNKSEIDNAQTH